jgi:DNA-binding NarL/FixJ family response regulator
MTTQETDGLTASRSTQLESASPVPASLIQIWLVDDDDRLRGLVAEWLKRFEGIQCTRDFNSPSAVLSALASKPGPDVILLDVQMGEQNGLDAVRPIRSLSRSTRVVMFTSSFDSERQRRAMADGASDFLLKFKPMEEVVARIRELAGEPAPVVRRRSPVNRCTSTPTGRERRRSWFHSRGDASRPRRTLNYYFDLFRRVRD